MKEKLEACRPFRQFVNDHPDYKFRIIGHSLGAGTATILTMLIKNCILSFPNLLILTYLNSDYADVKCIAYASPPVFDKELATAEETKELVINVIHNNDCVPRLSFNSLHSLKTSIVFLLSEYVKFHEEHPELPPARKWKMLLELGLKTVNYDLPDTAVYEQFFKSDKLNAGLEKALEDAEKKEKRCYLAGRQFHVEPLTLLERCYCVEPEPPTIREAKCEEFMEFPISKNLVLDHMPQEYFAVLKALALRIRDQHRSETVHH
jgi:hypothetical protein